MTFKKVLISAGFLLAAGFTQACENVAADDMAETLQSTDLATLAQNPAQARTYNYCNWAYDQGGKDLDLPNYDAMLDRKTSTLSPDEWSATALIDSGTRIAQNSKTKKFCQKTFQKGTRVFDKRMKKSLARHWGQAEYKKSNDAKIAAVQETLAKHWVEDQAARRVFLASRTDDKVGADHWTRRLAATQTAAADERSTSYMRGLLEEYDWIDAHRFGERVSMAAWLMMQHADDHVDLQALALSRMEPYLENGGVNKGNYAFLWDRVAVNSDKKQRFGTQPTWKCNDDGKLSLKPLEAPDTVNERRAKMGLDTVEEGLASMTKSVCG